MAKDVNIHVKAQGTEQTKQQLDGVAGSAGKLGTATEQAGVKASKAAHDAELFAAVLKRVNEQLNQADTQLFGLADSTKEIGKAKQPLDSAAGAAEKLGTETEKAGAKTSRASRWIMDGLKTLAGPLGFSAIVYAAYNAGKAIVKFYDDLKKKTDEAVKQIRELSGEFTELFEVVGAYDKVAQKNVVDKTLALFSKTKTPTKVGLPVVTEYIRQFGGDVRAGRITQQQYDQGLKQILEYENLHPNSGIEMTKAMSAWGINKPKEQAGFKGGISAGATYAKLNKKEFLDSFLRSTPTAQALNWDKNKLIEELTAITSGIKDERQKKSIPLTTIEALANPNIPEAKELRKLGISAETASDPEKLFEQLKQKRKTMPQKDYYKLLVKFYGQDAVKGIGIRDKADMEAIRRSQEVAAGPEGIAERRLQIAQQKETIVAKGTVPEILEQQLNQQLTDEQQYQEEIRAIGEKWQKHWEKTRPEKEAFRKISIPGGPETVKEHAAYVAWLEGLSEEQRQAILNKYGSASMGMGIAGTNPFYFEWQKMLPEQQYESIPKSPQQNRQGGNVTTIFDHSVHFHPRTGGSVKEPNAPRTLR